MMTMSAEIAEIAAALASAQGEMGHAAKDRMNPAYKSRYADLASVIDACRAILSAHKIALLQAPASSPCEGGYWVEVETYLIHASGQWLACALGSWVPDAKPTTIGSAVTYLRRYGLSAMTSVAADDDDGQAAVPRPSEQLTNARAAIAKDFPLLSPQAATMTDINALRDLYKRAAQAQTTQETP